MLYHYKYNDIYHDSVFRQSSSLTNNKSKSDTYYNLLANDVE